MGSPGLITFSCLGVLSRSAIECATVSRASRSRQRHVMKDPRMASMMDPKTMPFDGKRVIDGGFKALMAV